jgi:uncharacterized protein DUF3892
MAVEKLLPKLEADDPQVALNAAGVQYLKTSTDGEVPDNLLELPECY